MNNRETIRSIQAITIAVLSFFLTQETHAKAPKSNVLMICIDDLNDWTGFLGGHPEAVTPHMDALAKRGRNIRQRPLRGSGLFSLTSQRDVRCRGDDARQL